MATDPGGLYSFFAGSDNPNAPTNYAAMEARRRIALQLMASNARKGYPKTIGEGLTAIGDAIGEKAVMNRLALQEAAYQKAAGEAAASGIPPEARGGGAVTPQRTSAATPDEETQTAELPAETDAKTTTPAETDLRPPAQAQEPVQQTASLESAYGQQPLTPPAPNNDARNRIALAALQPNVPGGPLLNPTQPGDTLPGSQQPSPTLTPPAPGGQPQPDQAPVQLAQASGLPQVKAPLTNLPAQPVPTDVPVGKAPRLPVPGDVPMTREEIMGWNMRAKAVALGDPNLIAQADKLIQYGAGQRTQQYNAQMQDYRDRLLLAHQKQIADEAYLRGAPERAQAREKAAIDIAKARQFGGLSEEAALKPVVDSAKAVAAIPQAQVAIRNASNLVPQIFAGGAANIEMSSAKIRAAAGFPNDPRLAATQQFLAYIKPAVAAARQAQSGGANISDNDMKLALEAVGGDITLDRTAISRILEELQSVNTKAAIWHQDKVAAASGDDPQRQAFMFRSYGLPMQDIIPSEVTDYLRAHPTPEIIKQFDDKYHTPGLAQRILGGG